MPARALLGQVGDLGDGRIDNWIISSAVHVATGVVVVVSMVLATVLVVRHAVAGRPIDAAARSALLVAQIALVVQVLLGIKLLDQGQGIVQLYIHYIGGLMPLGAFLVAGWFARGDSRWSTRLLAVLLLLGTLSAGAAFFIGRAYASA
jgi:hypothetical protein